MGENAKKKKGKKKLKNRKTTTSSDAGAATMELDLFSIDVLVSIASYLDAEELANLALTGRRFGSRPNGETVSLAGEVARRVIIKEQTDAERIALPKYPDESWIALYHHLLLMRQPLEFDRLIGRSARDGFGYCRWGIPPGDKSRITTRMFDDKTAISNNVMRAGKHYATFKMTGFTGGFMRVGIIRPLIGLEERKDWLWHSPLQEDHWPEQLSQRTGRWGSSNMNCCMYYSYSGNCCWSDWETRTVHQEEWEGKEAHGDECELGLLLDLDAGTLAVYKDGRKLGVMKGGLSGEYCWVAVIGTLQTSCVVRIERGTPPEIDYVEPASH